MRKDLVVSLNNLLSYYEYLVIKSVHLNLKVSRDMAGPVIQKFSFGMPMTASLNFYFRKLLISSYRCGSNIECLNRNQVWTQTASRIFIIKLILNFILLKNRMSI